jgi:hypothetical protein
MCELTKNNHENENEKEKEKGRRRRKNPNHGRLYVGQFIDSV